MSAYFDAAYFDAAYFDAGAAPVADALIGYGRYVRMSWTLDEQRDHERGLAAQAAIARGVEAALERRRQEADDERALLALLS